MDKTEVLTGLRGFGDRLTGEVVNSYETQGSSFGLERFTAWRNKLTKFLDEHLPGESARLNSKLTHMVFVALRDESPAQRFWREDGEIARAFLDSLILDIENDEYAPEHPRNTAPRIESEIRENYAFVAMPMDKGNAALEDVLDAIKEAGLRCGIRAERVDDPPSNERITDRILESIRRAEFVIADLTNSRPNVYFEAGYAHALAKTPVYIAKEATNLEFDLKDYPVIFFKNLKQLKDDLETRLRALVAKRGAS
jgi:hypothetical protein